MDYQTKIDTMRDELRTLYKAIPETAKGFSALSKGVKDGAGYMRQGPTSAHPAMQMK